MGWLIGVLAIILLGMLPIGIYAAYDCGGPVASLIVGPLRFRMYPRPKGGKKRSKRSKRESAESGASAGKKQRGTVSDFISIAELVFEFLKDFKSKLRIRNLEFKLTLADSDPYDLSVHYGMGWALLGNLMPQLERFFVIRKRNLEIACDYTAVETLLEARIDMAITLGRLLWITLYHGPRILRKYNSIVQQTKGGNVS